MIISWDEYFMGVAKLSALRSKDPNTQVGCCIVNEKKKIVGVGYNGMPTGCDDKNYPWDVRQGAINETKYGYVVHSELNAILNATTNLENCTLYVTLFPCNECAKSIIQSGIKEVVYLDDKYEGAAFDLASKKMLQECKVAWRKMEMKDITL